jgi:outer membrane lipoprotein SlyB
MRKIYFLLIFFSVSACAAQKVVIDKQGVDMQKYEQDLAECRQYAEEIETGSEVAKGAVGGAVIGGAVGAIIGGRRTAETFGGVAAVTGAAGAGSSASQQKSQILKNCMRGRGYKVLN